MGNHGADADNDAAYKEMLREKRDHIFQAAERRGDGVIVVEGVELAVSGDPQYTAFLDTSGELIGLLHLTGSSLCQGHHDGSVSTRWMKRKPPMNFNFYRKGDDYFMGTEPSIDLHIYGQLVKKNPLIKMVEDYRGAGETAEKAYMEMLREKRDHIFQAAERRGDGVIVVEDVELAVSGDAEDTVFFDSNGKLVGGIRLFEPPLHRYSPYKGLVRIYGPEGDSKTYPFSRTGDVYFLHMTDNLAIDTGVRGHPLRKIIEDTRQK